MHVNLLTTLLFTLYCLRMAAQIPPALPNTGAVKSCFPDTTGYAVITVGPSGRDYTDLQAAIDAANPGSVLVLDAGVVFKGSFTLPDKTGDGWIVLISSRMNLLPEQEGRIDPFASTGNPAFPLQQDVMPKIITNNPAGLPCFRTMPSAHQYRFTGLEMTADTSVLNSYGLVFLGDAGAAQNSQAVVPHDLIVDRCYIHGHSKATIMKGGVLLNCANAAVMGSFLSDFHSIGYDTYAVAGTNGPGPFKIINNYLEAAGENILFGGAAPAIPGLVPSDIEVHNNSFFKPFSWRTGDPAYLGKHWTVKNLFELKTGKRVLLDGNVLENCWADLPVGQSGYAIVLTVRAEGGGAPQADVSDISITNNIIRHTGAGITLSGHDSPTPSLQSKRIKIANNVFDDINGPAYGDGNTAGPNDGVFIKIGDPSDVLIDHNTIFQTGAIAWAYDTTKNIAFTNNIFNCFVSGGGYQGIYGPGFAQGGNGPMGAYFPDITDNNHQFHKNVLIGGNPLKYSNYNTLSQNYFPAAVSQVNFVDFIHHNYALSDSSAYQNEAADESDIGVNFTKLDTALQASLPCPSVSAVLSPYPLEKIQIWPNPFHGQATLVSGLEMKDALLFVYNMQGQKIKHMTSVSGQHIPLELGDLPAGLYEITIVQPDQFVKSIKIAAF